MQKELDDIEKDKIIDKILLELENPQLFILDEHARRTTLIESKK